jgi:hypothetical protein
VNVGPATAGLNKVNFIAGPAVDVLGTFKVSEGNRLTDGVAYHEASILFQDQFKNPRAGDKVTFELLNAAETAVAVGPDWARFTNADTGPFFIEATSDASGMAVVRIYSRTQTPDGKNGFPIRARLDTDYSTVEYLPFSPDTANPLHSTFDVTPAPPATKTADGVEYFSGAIVLRDLHDLPVPGATASVTICKVEGTQCNSTNAVTVTSPSGGTPNWVAGNPNGDVNIRFVSTTVGTYRVTARIGEDAIGPADPKYREITFTVGDPDETMSELTTSNGRVTNNGVATHWGEAVIKDAFGNVVPNTTVRFTVNGSAKIVGATGTQQTIDGVTDAEGKVRIHITDTAEEYIALTAGFVVGGQVTQITNSPATLRFGPGTVDPDNSDFTVTPSTPVTVSDGSDSSYFTATVTLRDADDAPVQGETLTFTFNGAGPSLIGGGITANTNVSGVAQVYIYSQVSGPFTVTAGLADVQIGTTKNIVFIPGPIHVGNTDFTVTDGLVLNDGVAQHSARVVAKDAFGNVIPNVPVHLTITTGETSIPGPVFGTSIAGGSPTFDANTDANGAVFSPIVSQEEGTFIVEAQVGSPLVSKGTRDVGFTPGPPSVANSSWTVTPIGPIAVGSTTADPSYIITFTVKSASDLLVGNAQVRLFGPGSPLPSNLVIQEPSTNGYWLTGDKTTGSGYGKVVLHVRSQLAGTFPVTAQILPPTWQNLTQEQAQRDLVFIGGSCTAGPDSASYFDVNKLQSLTGTGAGDGVTFTIWLKDKYGNGCTPDPSMPLTVTVPGDSGAVVTSVTPVGPEAPGVYNAIVKDLSSEITPVSVQLAGEYVNVSGQPTHLADTNPQPVRFYAIPGPGTVTQEDDELTNRPACDATPGDTIIVTWPDGTTSETVVDANGCWSVTIPPGTSGETTVVSEDEEGHVSDPIVIVVVPYAPTGGEMVYSILPWISGIVALAAVAFLLFALLIRRRRKAEAEAEST